MTERPLTPRQQAFVAAYVGEAKGNATQAARLAGYSGSDATLAEQGRRTLGNAGVQHALDVFRMATSTERIMTAQQAAERLSAIAWGEATDQRIVGGKDDFVEAELRVSCSVQVEAIKALSKMRGYEAPAKSEVAVTATLAPEAEANLIAYLRSKRS